MSESSESTLKGDASMSPTIETVEMEVYYHSSKPTNFLVRAKKL